MTTKSCQSACDSTGCWTECTCECTYCMNSRDFSEPCTECWQCELQPRAKYVERTIYLVDRFDDQYAELENIADVMESSCCHSQIYEYVFENFGLEYGYSTNYMLPCLCENCSPSHRCGDFACTCHLPTYIGKACYICKDCESIPRVTDLIRIAIKEKDFQRLKRYKCIFRLMASLEFFESICESIDGYEALYN
jgi:hypothetical protein